MLQSNVVLAVACLVALVGSARATDIYNNSTNDSMTRFVYTGNEIGDEIILAGTERYLTNFAFEYFGTNLTGSSLFSGTPEVKVKFYLNDGAEFNGYKAPGTSFYESDWFGLGATTPRSTLNFNNSDFGVGGLPMPVVSNFTWSVQFRNLGVDDQVGLDIYDPPVVGQGYNDYWEFSGGSWALKATNAVPVSFGAVFMATVPEPSSVAFLVLGGLGVAAAMFRSRRN